MKKILIMLLLAAFSFSTFAVAHPQQDTTAKREKTKSTRKTAKKHTSKKSPAKKSTSKKDTLLRDTMQRKY